MFEVITLASGSAGNSLLVRGRSSAFLVDAGLSARQLATRLADCGVSLDQLSGVLLTHEHGDHTSALRVLLARQALPVFCNPLTARALREAGLRHENWKLFQTNSQFSVGEFSVQAFSVPHDAADPVGFRIAQDHVAFGVLTDLGYATQSIFEMLRGIEALLIETNYDEAMLQRCTRRPWPVKQRILSRHGHLSNTAAGQFVAQLDAPALRFLLLGHLSRDCNAPELAEGSVRTTLENDTRLPDLRLFCATQDAPSPVFRIA